MALFELRTYIFKSASAASAFYPRLQLIFTTVAQPGYNITTHGLFTSQSKPEKLVALVQYNQGQPDGKLNGFVGTEEFKKALSGFDMSSIVGVETETLVDSKVVES